jgi:hypothetical protein
MEGMDMSGMDHGSMAGMDMSGMAMATWLAWICLTRATARCWEWAQQCSPIQRPEANNPLVDMQTMSPTAKLNDPVSACATMVVGC